MKVRFSIRDLLWLALVVALAVGWWLDHQPKKDMPLSIAYPVRLVDPTAVLKILKLVFAGYPDVTLSLEPKMRLIIAFGTMPQHNAIQEIVKVLDQQPSPKFPALP